MSTPTETSNETPAPIVITYFKELLQLPSGTLVVSAAAIKDSEGNYLEEEVASIFTITPVRNDTYMAVVLHTNPAGWEVGDVLQMYIAIMHKDNLGALLTDQIGDTNRVATFETTTAGRTAEDVAETVHAAIAMVAADIDNTYNHGDSTVH